MHHYNLDNLSHEIATSDVLNSVDSASTNPVPVIYQSGYLTIKDYDKRFDTYTLGFPNREVEEGFVKFLMPYYTSAEKRQTGFEIQHFVREVEEGQCDAFLRRLQSLMAGVSYEQMGPYYQNVVFIISKLMGFYVASEYRTSRGRIDLVIGTDKYLYVLEFKLDGTAEEALRQIEGKEYMLPFAADGRQVFKIGVNFSSETRNIERWVVG